ncbi:MAG: radical SAM protein [Desulfovibrionaceae bacterium CG1_02_65_16]|nr:MAG: radical SAM protein [Desulfovibrionaceae bacterium CG1_02_65_16]
MIPLAEMQIIQIDVTNACMHRCSNCTRFTGHHRKPFFMDMETFKRAVDSLADFPGMVGMIGGEPLLHPHFAEMAEYLAATIPGKKRRGLWSTVPKAQGEKYGALIREVFGNFYFNDHSVDQILHQPLLVAAQEVVADKTEMWRLIDDCWIQKYWSASITPKGAFFCEVAASFDMLFDGPGGWPVEPGWWKRRPGDYDEQMKRSCPRCGCAIPLKRRPSSQEIDDVSPGNLEALLAIRSPKALRGHVEIYGGGLAEDWNPGPNWYMNELDRSVELEYRDHIAQRLGGDAADNAGDAK